MEIYEQIISSYLTREPHVFVSPQYSISGEKGEWSCPDLVALNFRDRKVIVAEVSTGWRTKRLLEKVKNRDEQWIHRLGEQLRSLSVIDERWKDEDFEVWVFVRKHARADFEAAASVGPTRVRVFVLEELGAPWEWKPE